MFIPHRIFPGKLGPHVGYRCNNYGVCNATFTDYPSQKKEKRLSKDFFHSEACKIKEKQKKRDF